MNNYDDFTGLYPVSKTLRFELRPMGKTAEKLKELNYLEDDENRFNQYVAVKGILDDNHRIFIDRVLNNASIDWKELIDAYISKKKDNSDASKKELQNQQDIFNKKVSKLFTDDPKFKDLFSKVALDDMMKIVKEEGDIEKIHAMEAFDRFSVYFTGYHEARRNIYLPLKSVSISWRIVVDNMPRFLDNAAIYEKIKEESPEILFELKKNLEIKNLDQYFDINNYGKFITQSEIEDYNYVLDGKTTESEHIQGLNVLLNLRCQQDPSFKKVLMKPLYKQILSNRERRSYIPLQFEDQKELLAAVCKFINEIDESGITSIFPSLINDIENYDLDKIFISQSELTELSVLLFGSWEALGGMLQTYRASQIGDPEMEKSRKAVDKWLKSSEFSLRTILDAIEMAGGNGFNELLSKVTSCCNVINEYPSTIESIKTIELDNVDEDHREESANRLRVLLEPYQGLLRMMRIFVSSEELSRDEAFYSDLDSGIEKLMSIVPLFNKVRNYCTRKSHDVTKIKVKLSIPTLANGWDINKENDNRAIIMRKDDRYFLAVLTPKSKLKFDEPVNEGDSYYEKMNYKLLPDPSKMLPKVFIKSKSWLDEHDVPQFILDGYDAGKHKKGENFDLEFCHKLIDYYKECSEIYPGWDVFGFKFSDTMTYNDLSDFYREVSEQGYSVSFTKVSSDYIYKSINEGKLLLFQIYNKDFSEKTKGCPNLHTIYWKALFSDENLKTPCLKLNGQAELFFRHLSIPDGTQIIHKKGEKLVFRRDVDNTSIPSDVYKELNKYYRGKSTVLSDNAKKYLDKVRVRDAEYDIVKDRRYTVDKMFFHVPMTFNYKVRDSSSELNTRVIEKIVNDRDLKIIGIDRGERNLIYYSMIDRNGNILDQDSLNIIDGYDYQKSLDVRERGNKESRKNWTKVEGIKQFKEGYISKVISKLAEMIINENAVIVMEDLNYGFKKGRFKIEKQVYQKFENMLINKLNYLVFKRITGSNSGSVLKGYQLTKSLTDVTNVGKQTGVIFYIPATMTSKIDPTTGFANLFNLGAIVTAAGRKEFFSKMDSIRYDPVTDSFIFEFDYNNYGSIKSKDYRGHWSVYTVGRRYHYNLSKKIWEDVDSTSIIRDVFESAGVSIAGELKDKVCGLNGDQLSRMMFAFSQTMDMRVKNQTEDYIHSPVMNEKGIFFKSCIEDEDLPVDSDANGAYNIALKGELLFRMIEKEYVEGEKMQKLPLMSLTDWLTFVQSGKRSWKS